MRRITIALALLTALASTPSVAAQAAGGEVHVTVSNFRYCQAQTCVASDQAYVRSEAGPVPGTDRPGTVVEVAPGDTVVWTYRDTTMCDNFGEPKRCAGHGVQFEKDQAIRGVIGLMAARQGPTTLRWTVPAAAPGLYRYYCDLGDDHWGLGVTGAVRIGG